MERPPWVPEGIDTERPSAARISSAEVDEHSNRTLKLVGVGRRT